VRDMKNLSQDTFKIQVLEKSKETIPVALCKYIYMAKQNASSTTNEQ
jgi:hypothetical protein